MLVGNLKNTVKEAGRLAVIVETFFRYGLEDVFDRTSLSKRFGFPFASEKGKKGTTPEKLRLAFEELGPAFVKLGQFLSTRPDILPADYVAEFEKLQDAVAPVKFPQIKKSLRASLGKPLEKIFSSFDKEPIASASIAQVHAARLVDGTRVAVKVKRPDIEKVISADTEIILELAKFLKKREIVDEVWRPVEIAEQFRDSLKDELDFRLEAANQKRFAANFADTPSVKIPALHAEFCGDDVITMEFVSGTKLNRIIKDKAGRYPKKEIAKIGAHACFKQVFMDSFFHGDLHPGNLLWLGKERRLGFVDFGIVGRLNDNELRALTIMLQGIVSFDADKVVLAVEGLGVVDSSQQSDRLRDEAAVLLDKYRDAALKDIKVATLIQEVFSVMAKLKIRLPVGLIGLGKTMVIVEAMASSLDPDFSIFEFSQPYIEAAVRRQASLPKLMNKAENNLLRVGQLAENLPADLGWILSNLKNNNFKIKVEHEKLHETVGTLRHIGNRLSASVIVTGLVVGSSYIMPNFRTVGLVGYVIASFLALGILWSIMRKDRV